MNFQQWKGQIETRVQTLEHEVERLRTRAHNLPQELIGTIELGFEDLKRTLREKPTGVPDELGEGAAVKHSQVKISIASYVAGISSLLLVLKLMGKL